MHDEDTCCVDGCSEPVHVRRSRKFPHLSGACKYHYHAEASYRPAGRPEPRACLWCGVEFQPSRMDHRCCSKSCSTSWGVRGRRNLNSIPRSCEFCGVDLTGTRRRFCSQRCRGRATEHPGRVCVSCGDTFWRTSRTSVCEPCAVARGREEDAARAERMAAREAARLIRPVLVPGRMPAPPRGPFVAALCPECGDAFVMTDGTARMGTRGGKRYCSSACGKRAWRRDHRHRRRDRREGRRIHRAQILERDGYCCRLCGDPLDLSADVPHPLAPVIDHIVPLALGGEHAQYNVQAAHFLCNSRKRDVLEGQVAMPV